MVWFFRIICLLSVPFIHAGMFIWQLCIANLIFSWLKTTWTKTNASQIFSCFILFGWWQIVAKASSGLCCLYSEITKVLVALKLKNLCRPTFFIPQCSRQRIRIISRIDIGKLILFWLYNTNTTQTCTANLTRIWILLNSCDFLKGPLY